MGEFVQLTHIHSVKRKSLRPINHLPFQNMRTSPSLHCCALVKRHQSLTKYYSNSNICQIRSMALRSVENCIPLQGFTSLCLPTLNWETASQNVHWPCYQWERWKKKKRRDQTEGPVLCISRIFPPVCPLTRHYWLSSFVGSICGMFWLLTCMSRFH